MKLLNYLKTRPSALLGIAALLMLFTCGIPFYWGEFGLYSIHDMANDWRKAFVAVGALIVLGWLVAFLWDEYKGGNKYKAGKYE